MKKLLLTLLIFQSLISIGQTQDFSTIYIYSRDSKISIFMNDIPITTVERKEYLELKMFSEGKVTLVIIDESFKSRLIKNFEFNNGNKYYFEYLVKFGPKYEFNKIEEVPWNISISKAKGIQKYEEDRNKPFNQPTAEAKSKGPKSGTGFLLSESGLVVTNHHVIDKANKIVLKGINGDYTTSYSAKIVVNDEKNDLAILQVENKTIKFQQIPYKIRTNGAQTGEEIYVLGYPMIKAMGEEVKLTTGVISAKTGYQGDITSYQVSAPVQGGNSGGPLFDKEGNLTGIINAKIMGAEGVTYAIKTNYLNALIDLLPTTPIINTTNKLVGLSIQEQVKQLSNFVYIIEVNN